KRRGVAPGYGRRLGSSVLGWARETTLAKARADGHAVAESKGGLFEESDVLSLHLRLIDATRGLVTAADLARMKPTALLVNTSRAGLVAPGALEAALRAGRPAMAAVDVFEEEPVLGARHPLLSMDNAVCTPHLGYVERDGLEHMFSMIFDQMVAYAGGEPMNVVNPEASRDGRPGRPPPAEAGHDHQGQGLHRRDLRAPDAKGTVARITLAGGRRAGGMAAGREPRSYGAATPAGPFESPFGRRS